MGNADREVLIKVPEYYRGGDDEIDILQIFRAIAGTWKTCLIILIAVTIIFLTYYLFDYNKNVKHISYSKIIEFTFRGVDDDKYANGSPFYLSDIISPIVVQSVFEKYRLRFQSLGMDSKELLSRLSIEPYTPEYQLIVAKYKDLLTRTSLTLEQLQSIQIQQQQELSQARQGYARLRLDAFELDINKIFAVEVLAAIPREWARQQIEEKGVLKLDLDLVTAQALDKGLFEEVDYIVFGDLLETKINALKKNMQTLRDTRGITTVKDPVTGMMLPDVIQTVNDLERYVVNDVLLPIRSLGLTRQSDFSLLYYQEKKRELENELVLLTEESNLIKNAYDSYNKSRMDIDQERVLPQVVQQFSGEFLDRLANMTSAKDFEQYRQSLNERWLQTNIQVATARKNLRETERMIDMIKDKETEASSVPQQDKAYIDKVNKMVPQIMAQLKNYYDVVSRIYAQASSQETGGLGRLYRETHGDVLKSAPDLEIKKAMLLYGLLVMLTLIVTIPAAIIISSIRKGDIEVPGDLRDYKADYKAIEAGRL